jgi:hypothetical protein
MDSVVGSMYLLVTFAMLWLPNSASLSRYFRFAWSFCVNIFYAKELLWHKCTAFYATGFVSREESQTFSESLLEIPWFVYNIFLLLWSES